MKNNLEQKVKYLCDTIKEADENIDELEHLYKCEKNKYFELEKGYNKILSKNKDDSMLIYKLEEEIFKLNNKIQQLEEKQTGKSKSNNNLLEPLINKKEKSNEIDKLLYQLNTYQEKIEYLEKQNNEFQLLNIDLEKNLKDSINKNSKSDLSFEDELYILNKKNNMEALKEDINKSLEHKKKLEIEIFDLKSLIAMLENKKNTYTSLNENKNKKSSFCCFL